ncbi:hypothetical protein COB72_08090 [bacterium]|nr:MAG: hypothetical protein COB72_08090 [bacterium]
MNTHTPNEQAVNNRLASLERSSNRWRLAAVGSITLLAGLLIGGMGTNSTLDAQPQKDDPKAIIDYVGTSDTIYRIHNDGSITYLKIPKGERTAQGYFGWGNIKIDKNYKSRDLPQ